MKTTAEILFAEFAATDAMTAATISPVRAALGPYMARALPFVMTAWLALWPAAPTQAERIVGSIVVDGVVHEVNDTDDFATLFNSVVGKRSRLVEVFGDHDVHTSLDLTNHRHNTVFDFSGARLFAYVSSDVVMVQDRETGWRSIDQVPASARP